MSQNPPPATGTQMHLAPYRRQQLSLAEDVRAWLGGPVGEGRLFGIFSEAAERPRWYHRSDEEPLSKDTLFAPNDQGFCYLDAADTWSAFGAVQHTLRAQGAPLTKADLLRKGGDGCSFLEQAARSGAFEEVAQYLEAQGERLEFADLTDGGKPNGVFKGAVAWGQHDMLFEEARWNGRSAVEFRRTLALLPPSAREALGSVYALAERIAQAENRDLQIGR